MAVLALAAYWLCANLAADGPLCLLVDDAHWADAPSLRYLSFLLTRLEELDAALIVATRPRETDSDEGLLAAVTDPVFVDACLLATRGTPFMLRALVEAMSEGGITPTAEAATHVERIGARTIGRSIRVRLRRLPEHARRLARALAVLEQGDLLQAARLAELDGVEASNAAEVLTTAGILEAREPLTFIHPIVRTGIYSDLTSTERAERHRRAAR